MESKICIFSFAGTARYFLLHFSFVHTKNLLFLYGVIFSYSGKYKGHNYGEFFSSNEAYLYEIKELFGLKGKVRTLVEPGTVMEVLGKMCETKGMYSIHIDPQIFDAMMNSYEHSLRRKRPSQTTSGELNYLDLL
ncbi:MAG: hypothetical protein EU529_09465 [Promethearchaeota archaeon]|nr:MAG: hypothetical protein EU529_09465 [Candidatus Lokiarchaeota archaeon]